MTAKEHYDKHLAKVYSWMLGDFRERMAEQRDFFFSHGITPSGGGPAFDLGAGTGIQSVALATLGFHVLAVDFSRQLLDELEARRGTLPIETTEQDVLEFLGSTNPAPQLIVCMGDTLTHFRSYGDVEKIIQKASHALMKGGKFVVSWRDLAEERRGADRFIPVRADDGRMMTCFLEYFPDHVMVHDLIVEKEDGQWRQRVSSYSKLRIPVHVVKETLSENAFVMRSEELIRGTTYLVAEKR